MKNKTKRNYIISLILFVIGIIPFIYVVISSIPSYKGFVVFGDKVVYGLSGILYNISFYFVFMFPLFIIPFILILFSLSLALYTKIKKR